MHSEVKLFMITEGVFLCVGNVPIQVPYGMELNDLSHCGAALKLGTSMAGWTRGWRSLDLDRDMVASQVANETLVGGTASGDLSVNGFGEQHR